MVSFKSLPTENKLLKTILMFIDPQVFYSTFTAVFYKILKKPNNHFIPEMHRNKTIHLRNILIYYNKFNINNIMYNVYSYWTLPLKLKKKKKKKKKLNSVTINIE